MQWPSALEGRSGDYAQRCPTAGVVEDSGGGSIKTARTIAGFKITRGEFASTANVSGVRSKTLTFSRRHDSLTAFATNADYGHGRRAGAWTGADKTIVAMCRRVLRAAKVPAGEIAAIEIQREMGQTAQRVAEGEFRVGEPVLLRKIARGRRAVRVSRCGLRMPRSG